MLQTVKSEMNFAALLSASFPIDILGLKSFLPTLYDIPGIVARDCLFVGSLTVFIPHSCIGELGLFQFLGRRSGEWKRKSLVTYHKGWE